MIMKTVQKDPNDNIKTNLYDN